MARMPHAGLRRSHGLDVGGDGRCCGMACGMAVNIHTGCAFEVRCGRGGPSGAIHAFAGPTPASAEADVAMWAPYATKASLV